MKIKGKFKWEDCKSDLSSNCALPAYGFMAVSPDTDLPFGIMNTNLNKTCYEELEDIDKKYNSNHLEYIIENNLYKDILYKKLKDIITYHVIVYRAVTDCSYEPVGKNFKTQEEAKKFAENWYLNEIQEFIEIVGENNDDSL